MRARAALTTGRARDAPRLSNQATLQQRSHWCDSAPGRWHAATRDRTAAVETDAERAYAQEHSTTGTPCRRPVGTTSVGGPKRAQVQNKPVQAHEGGSRRAQSGGECAQIPAAALRQAATQRARISGPRSAFPCAGPRRMTLGCSIRQLGGRKRHSHTAGTCSLGPRAVCVVNSVARATQQQAERQRSCSQGKGGGGPQAGACEQHHRARVQVALLCSRAAADPAHRDNTLSPRADPSCSA